MLATYSEEVYTYVIDSADRVTGMQGYYDDSINPRSTWEFDSTWVILDNSESPGKHIFMGIAHEPDSNLVMGFQVVIVDDSIYIPDRPYADICIGMANCCAECEVRLSGCYCPDPSEAHECEGAWCNNVFSGNAAGVANYF